MSKLDGAMLAKDELAYYAMRADQERNRVATAGSAAVRAVNQTLADRYQAIFESGKLPEARRSGSLSGR